jgi:hypothetical protein
MQHMRTKPPTVDAETAFWQRVRLQGDLSVPQARALLKLQFSDDDQARMKELSAKARAGTLEPQEQIDIDLYEQLGCLLDILHSQARRALRQRRQVS